MLSILTERFPVPQLRRTLDWFLPASCVLCGGDAGRDPVCPGCVRDLPPIAPDACPRCAQPAPDGHCRSCQRQPPQYDATIAGFTYGFPVDHLIHALKYGHQLGIARWLGEQLSQRFQPPPDSTLIPVALHPTRLKGRGFNQSLEIARPLARRWGCPLQPFALARLRDTPPQAGRSRQDRLHNVRGAFVWQAGQAPPSVILVDDVMTTGQTVDEIARVLKLHGTQRVTVVVAARAQAAD